MAVVNTDFLADFRTATYALFDQFFGQAPATYKRFTTEVPTTKEINKLNWLGAPPMLQDFTGSVVFGKAFTHDYTVTVTEQGIGIEISKAQMRRDDTGTISLFVANFMAQAAKYLEKICHVALSDGFDNTSWDGVNFYSAIHSFGGVTWDNLDTALLNPADSTSYDTGWETINTAPDDTGTPMAFVPDTLVVHSHSRSKARKLIEAETNPSGITNILKNDVEVLVSPFLDQDTDEWHLLATGQPVKPILLFVEQAPELIAQDGLESDSSVERRVFRYVIEAAVKRAFGDPRSAYGSNGSAA